MSRKASREKGLSTWPAGNMDSPFSRLGGVRPPLPDTLLPSTGPAHRLVNEIVRAKGGDYFQAKSAPRRL